MFYFDLALDPYILAFSTPEKAPTKTSLGLKKNWEKKVIKITPKKRYEHCLLSFVLARWRGKKKPGLSRRKEKVAQVIWVNA
jgi:hypothetical protein